MYNKGFLCLKLIVKRIISAILVIVPYAKIQKMRVCVMKRYAEIETKCVCSTVSQDGYDRQVMSRDIYGTPTLYDFEDTQFYGPEHFDVYLSQLYGVNYMQMPPVERRVKPHDAYLVDC